jgi:hypothetical protein
MFSRGELAKHPAVALSGLTSEPEPHFSAVETTIIAKVKTSIVFFILLKS